MQLGAPTGGTRTSRSLLTHVIVTWMTSDWSYLGKLDACS